MNHQRNKDQRGNRVVFAAHCLLNTNAKVYEYAERPAMYFEILKLLHEHQIGILQFPCPETLYLGLQRWWHVKNQYDTPGYRNHCRQLAGNVLDQVRIYRQEGAQVVAFLGIDGSPTCGMNQTVESTTWGGRPASKPEENLMVPGMGIWFEELTRTFEKEKEELPPFYGLELETPEKPYSQVLEELEAFLKEAS